MARLVGIGLVLWAVYLAFSYSFEHFPDAEPAGATPVIVEDEAPPAVDLVPERLSFPDPGGPSFSPGAWAVGPSPDPRIARRDRDVRQKVRLFVDDADDLATSPEGGGERQLVEGEIEPGQYVSSFNAEDCAYELWRVARDGTPRVIAEEYLAAGRVMVSINGIEPDWFTATDGCGQWYPWQPLPSPLTTAGSGDYWASDLAQGVWFVPAPCRWEEVAAFRGAEINDVSAAGSGPGSLTIDDETLGIRLRGCRAPITLTSATGDAP